MRPYVLLSALLVLSACGAKEDSITVKDADGNEKTITSSSEGGTTTLSTDDGKVVIKDGGEGASFPPFAPQYPGSEILGSAKFDGSGGKGGSGSMVTQRTGDDPAKVMAFYKGTVTDAGMKIGMETTTPEGGLLMVGTPGKDSGMMITVSKDGDGKTTVAFIGGQGK